MYGIVLLAAMSAGTAEAPAFHNNSWYNWCTLDSCHPIRYGWVAPFSCGYGQNYSGYGYGGSGCFFGGHGYSYGCGYARSYGCGGGYYGCGCGGCNGWYYPLYSVGGCTGSCYGSCFGHAWGQTDTYHPGVGAGYAGFGAYGNYGAYGVIPAPVNPPAIYGSPVQSGTIIDRTMPPTFGGIPGGYIPPSGGSGSLVPDINSPLLNPIAPKTEPEFPPALTPKVSRTVAGIITVEVPENARVYIDGSMMRSGSTIRTFRTPALEQGQEYFYTIRVIAEENGRTLDEAKKIFIRSGEQTTVNFFNTKSERPQVAELRR